MSQIDFINSQKIDAIFKEAVDKAIAKHKERGESIAIADKNGKVVVVAPEDRRCINRGGIAELKQSD